MHRSLAAIVAAASLAYSTHATQLTDRSLTLSPIVPSEIQKTYDCAKGKKLTICSQNQEEMYVVRGQVRENKDCLTILVIRAEDGRPLRGYCDGVSGPLEGRADKAHEFHRQGRKLVAQERDLKTKAINDTVQKEYLKIIQEIQPDIEKIEKENRWPLD